MSVCNVTNGWNGRIKSPSNKLGVRYMYTGGGWG